MPYGWRMVRAWALGLLMAVPVSVLTWVSYPKIYEGLSEEAKTFLLYSHYDVASMWRGGPLFIFLLLLLSMPRTAMPRPSIDGPGRVTLCVLAPILLLFWWPESFSFYSFKSYIMPYGSGIRTWIPPWSGPWSTVRHGLVKLGTNIVLGAPTYVLLAGPPLICHWIETLKENQVLRRMFLSGRGGSSRWAGPGSLKKYSLSATTPLSKSIPLGVSLFDDDFGGRVVAVHDDSHMLTVGMPGSGKSLTAIWPTLLSYGGSCIVIDPKGEHAKMTMDYRKERGPTWLLDPFGVVAGRESAGYNLLSEIDINHPSARMLISAISKSCVNTSRGENKFWEESARVVMDGAIAHVLSTQPRENQNLPYVADLMMGFDPETGFADPGKFDEFIIEMRTNSAAGGLPQLGASTLDDLGDRAKGSVIAELRNALKWATDPAMRKQLTPDENDHRNVLQFTDFARNMHQPRTLYIAIPFGAMVEQARWLRCLSEVAMKTALRMRENNSRPNPPSVMILDELPQYGKDLQGIKEGMVTLRDAGLKLWAFVQNHKQLVDCFGEDGSKNFESGATVQVFGVNDVDTAEWIASKLGRHGIVHKVWKRWKFIFFRVKAHKEETDLVDAAAITRELQQNQPMQYVFPTNGTPMRLHRRAFRTVRVGGRKIRGIGFGIAGRAGSRQ